MHTPILTQTCASSECGRENWRWRPERPAPQNHFRQVRWYHWRSTPRRPGSTGRNEPDGLSTPELPKAQNGHCDRELVRLLCVPCRCSRAQRNGMPLAQRGATKFELASDHGSLHPQRPSGRCPHRPLTFFLQQKLVQLPLLTLSQVRSPVAGAHLPGHTQQANTRRNNL